MLYRLGDKFRVVKNGCVGEINGVSQEKIYSMVFSDKIGIFLSADVFESSITGCLKYGVWERCE